ncbi:tryptophan 7-halogenase [Rheinheimera riviphila]|uniref:Tryptophan 7-halogenase n=1 Tax=Rheinheimera riviphila TaxID=1834037 RepID=A0A437R5J2_9GAMM|nr:tryptophan halogenase family protein [Rheinheimera riviphila]RVU42046.1 tryptophan 7-halogenase [Rheinheimera riviphila]
MTTAVKKLVIVGGGTAGWLSAAIIAAQHRSNTAEGLQVMLVESADIPTIGVGEGTWPTMKNTLQQIGLKEADVFAHCHAVFKQGGKFVNWVRSAAQLSSDSGPEQEFYYHPFTVPMGYGRIDLAPYVDDVSQFAIDSNFQHQICEAGLAPRTLAEGEYQGQCNYAYHLDAGAFADLLKQHCKTKLGVEQRIGTVERCELTADGQIKALHLTDGSEPIEADLFVDCTGFASLLLGKTLGVPFESVDHLLFNDSALAMQVPYDNPDAPIPCHTIATAQNAGWIWDIGLTHRRGVGHVYAAKYLSDDEAEFNLRRYIGKAAEGVAVRKISFATGHRTKFWQHNCVAIGMAAGFVEPLEATAIMLVEISARFVADNLPADQATMPLVARRFNQQMLYRWQRILDFLKLHYMLTKRPEPYWQAHLDPATIPQSLQDDLQLWRHRGPQIADFNGALELFPAASYQYVLYGMGFKPDFSAQAYLYQQQGQAQQIIRRNQQLTTQMLQTLPSHRDYINRWLAGSRG